MAQALTSWHDGQTKDAIVEFVRRVTDENSADYVAPAERIAVFDNDGTLWCEKPMPIELVFILRRLVEMVGSDDSLRERQPWKAAHEQDYAWLGGAINKHYAGDDSDVALLLGGIVQAFAGMTVEDYADSAHGFLTKGDHPTLGRAFSACAYTPMIDLLRYLEAHGFSNFIASGGDRDFMRPVTDAIYGIPSERVIGSSNALGYEPGDHGGRVVYMAKPDFFDDGPVKPVRIWSRVGRRPILACGNSNGDIEMLRYAGGATRPAFRLLVDHDDSEREFAYRTGAEKAFEAAAAEGWTVASIKTDWKTVFPDVSGAGRRGRALTHALYDLQA